MKKKRDDGLDYIRKHMPKGLWIYEYKGKIILKFPYSRDHEGHRLRKYNTVCAVPTNRQEKKDVKGMVLDLAKLRAKEFFEHDKFGIKPDWMTPTKPTFKGLAEEYMEEKDISPSKIIRDCIDRFKHTPIDSIRAFELEAFYKELLNTPKTHCAHGKIITQDETLGLASVKQRKRIINKIFRYARGKGFIENNIALDAQIPMDEVKRLDKEMEGKQKAISPTEFLVIHSEINPTIELWAASLIAFLTGMRAGEVYGLEAERIITNNEYPFIKLEKQHVSRGPARIVPLMPPLVKILEPLCQDRIGRIFRTKKYDQTWVRAVEKAGVTHWKGNIRFHDLRSSFITLMEDAGVEDEIRMKIVGHTVRGSEELKISQIHMDYLDPFKKRLNRAIMQVYQHLLQVEEKFQKIAVNQ
jgi:integrase